MPDVSLKEFIRTGEFGPVRLGMTREAVVAALGPPASRGPASRTGLPPGIDQYGDIEFHFDEHDGTLWLIHLEELARIRVPRGGDGFELDPWIIQADLTAEALEAALAGLGVRYAIGPDRWHPGCRELKTESNVKFLFVDEVTGLGVPAGLDALSISGSRRPLHVKQISATLPKAIYDTVRREALRQRTSISRLCRGWIMERVTDLPEDDA